MNDGEDSEVSHDEGQSEEEKELNDSNYEQSDAEIEKGKQVNPDEKWNDYPRFTIPQDVPANGEGNDSDYEMNDLQLDYGTSDDEDRPRRGRGHFPIFNPNIDFKDMNIKVGIQFASKDILKRAVKDFGIKEHRPIKMVKNDKLMVKFEYKVEGGCEQCNGLVLFDI